MSNDQSFLISLTFPDKEVNRRLKHVGFRLKRNSIAAALLVNVSMLHSVFSVTTRCSHRACNEQRGVLPRKCNNLQSSESCRPIACRYYTQSRTPLARPCRSPAIRSRRAMLGYHLHAAMKDALLGLGLGAHRLHSRHVTRHR